MATKSARFTGGNIAITHLQYLIKGRGIDSRLIKTKGGEQILSMSARSDYAIDEAIKQARDHGFIVEELPQQQDN